MMPIITVRPSLGYAGLAALLCAVGLVACQTGGAPEQERPSSVPSWAQDAVFYQIFPERFRSGDATNDPGRASLQHPVDPVPEGWAVTPWTRNWYEQADWERQIGSFYDAVNRRRYGGDLQGVIDRLDYLDSLGVNTLYFNPVFWARSLHKYDGNSYHHIDPHFGPSPERDFALMAEESPADPSTWHVTAADSLFFALLDAAHARDMRIIIDGVFNHTGRDFFAFQDLQDNQQDSRYADWYIVDSFDDPTTPDTSEFAYEGWWGVASLPVFADNEDGTNLHPGPKQYVMDATRRWMDPNGDGDPSDGVDGWRLDVANEMPIGFWREWNAFVRSINPEAYTVSEVWENAASFIEEGGFSATMNYYGFAFPVKGFLVDYTIPPSAFAEMLAARRDDHTEPVRYALQNLIDSHDTPRLASMIVNRTDTGYAKPDWFDYDWGETVSPRNAPSYNVTKPAAEDRKIQRLVALFQMTYVGAPMVYYGTESGMWGADDPDDRKPMVWDDKTYEVEDAHPLGSSRAADSVRFEHDVYDFYRSAIRFRRAHPALRRGTFHVVHTADEQGWLTYVRAHQGSTLLIAINRSPEPQSTTVPLPDSLRGAYQSVLSTGSDGVEVGQGAEGLTVALPGLSGIVLKREEE